MEIRIAESESELELVGNLMLQLRSNYDLPAIIRQIKAQQKRRYTLAYINDVGFRRATIPCPQILSA